MTREQTVALILAGVAVMVWSLAGLLLLYQRHARAAIVALPLALSVGMLCTSVAVALGETFWAQTFAQWNRGMLAFGGVVTLGRAIQWWRRDRRARTRL